LTELRATFADSLIQSAEAVLFGFYDRLRAGECEPDFEKAICEYLLCARSFGDTSFFPRNKISEDNVFIKELVRRNVARNGGDEECVKLYCNFLLGSKFHVGANFPYSSSLPFELAYVQTKINNDYDERYWDVRSATAVMEIMSGSESNHRLLIYELTHVIFFSTDFGSYQPKFSSIPAIRVILISLINQLLPQLEWDLLTELAISLICISPQHDDYREILSKIILTAGDDGLIFSEGLPSQTSQSPRHVYSRYHTTLVALVFCAVQERRDRRLNLSMEQQIKIPAPGP
jgi:hypothetical protein